MDQYQQQMGRSGSGATATHFGAPFTPLEREARTHVDTACAAFHLTRRPKTLHAWASKENGPIRPHRVNVRLVWPVAALRQLLGSN
jgi:hypothetical protein